MSQLEQAGVATVVLGTTAFTQAAEEQWQALGFPIGPFVPVGHPLGSMPLEQVLAEAEQAVEPVLERLTAGRATAATSRPSAPRAAVQSAAAPAPGPIAACGHAADEEDP